MSYRIVSRIGFPRPGVGFLCRYLVLWLAGILLAGCADEGSGPTPNPSPPVVAAVVVQPGQGDLYVGEQRAYAARALDATGGEITGRMVAWSSTAPGVATISADGVVTAVGVGTTEVRALIDGSTGVAHLKVVETPVASVTLDPADLHLWEGEHRPVAAVARDAAGRVLDGRQVVWSSPRDDVATVGADGLITAVGAGQVDVAATIETITAAVRVTVSRRAVASLVIVPGPSVLTLGDAVQLSAVARDADGGVLEGRAVQWSVDNANVTITASGLLTAVRDGYATVTVASEGVSASIGITIVDDAEYGHDLLYHRFTTAGVSELFVLMLGAGQPPERLNAGTVSRSPTASPDGSRVAFAVSMTELGTGLPVDDIYVIDRIGGMHIKRLTDAPGIDEQPAWSPAGGRIAYRRTDVDGRSDIWVMHEDGSGAVNLTADMDPSAARSSPAWTRDGARLAFGQIRNGPDGTTASIWTMRADGSDKVRVTNTLTGFDSAPTWSPDGARLAFVRYYGAEADIAILRLSDGVITRIPLPGLQASPAWSPDGELIAFTQHAGGTSEIYTMRHDGQLVRLRTSDRSWGGGLAPSWIRRP